MAKRSDLLMQATEMVIDTISATTSRLRTDIDLDTLLDDLGLTRAETADLLSKIIAASRMSGFRKLAPQALDHAKAVRDIVDIMIATRFRPKKAIVIPDIVVEGDVLPGDITGGHILGPGKFDRILIPDIDVRPGEQEPQKAPETAPRKTSRAKPGSAGMPGPLPDVLELHRESSSALAPAGNTDARAPAPSGSSASNASPSAAENSGTAPRAETERQVNVWIGNEDQPSDRMLTIGETYPLSFRVGTAVKASLISGPEAEISADIPPGGLLTRWQVITRDAELATTSSDAKVEVSTIEDGTQCWCGLFELLIPEVGDSVTQQLKVTPRKPAPRIDVIVTARGEPYRQFRILLKASDKPGTAEAIVIEGKSAFAPGAEIGLRTSHEWTTPNSKLRISVIDGPRVAADGVIEGNEVRYPSEPWGTPAKVDGPLKNVRAAAEALRVAFEKHFDEIDAADLAERLRRWNKQPAQGWGVPYWPDLQFYADGNHEAEWQRMAVSVPLRELAIHGKSLFDAFFPPTSRIRAVMKTLPAGTRLDIAWTDGASFIPHVPWGLMYTADIPSAGKAVDPLGFLGMRCRIAYTCYDVFSASRALGAFKDTHRTHFLYWGIDERDVTGREARWQRDLWKDWGNQIFVPKTLASGSAAQQPADTAKTELLQLLDKPEPAPTSLLYMFCQSDTETGNVPILRFSDTNDPVNIIKQTDFGTTAFTDRPLIFANACGTASADTYQANMLEKLFFARDCRAYLGTEIKVPIVLASRFATIFFHFFYRMLDPAPMAAGEAAVQARLFLWTHYRNLGGLFYCYINQYDLYVADKQEVQQLRV